MSKDKGLVGQMDYEQSKQILTGDDVEARRALALRTDVKPEILYYLVNDPDEQVRKNVSQNMASPRHADALLVHDSDCEVRQNIAHKLGEIVPSMKSQPASMQALSNSLVETLAADAAAEVRKAVAETLCELDDVPVHVVQQLARDVEAAVAAPMLAKSPILTQDDLLEVIEGEATSAHLIAIAEREGISGNVCDALVRKGESDAISVMLSNNTAQIREDTLDVLLDEAEHHPEWHEPLVHRPRLPSNAVLRLSEFVAGSLIEVLVERTDMDRDTVMTMAEQVKSRLIESDEAARNLADERGRTGGVSRSEAERAFYQQAEIDFGNGVLNEESLSGAMDRGEKPYVLAGLSLMTEFSPDIIAEIVDSQSPRAIVALCWSAELTMAFAVKLQTQLGRIESRACLKALHDGSYPLQDADMKWQLKYFGAVAQAS
ncbi:MAG: hypothetical protein Alpg2KO_26910 [Alphaproteobacteria bacterium]